MVSNEKEEKIIREIQMLVKIFLITRLSDIELANKTGLSSSTVGRRLTDKERILKAFPDKGEKVYTTIQKLRKLNLAKGKMLGAETSKMNYGTDEVKQNLNINVFGVTQEKQMNVLKHMILTFRPKLSLLSELFQIEENQLYELIMLYAKDSSESIKYIFEFEYTDQNVAREKIISFYQDLVNAKNSKDKNEISSVWAQIDDSRYERFKNNRQPLSRLCDEDIELVVSYQLKKCCAQEEACKTLGISFSQYKIRLKEIICPGHPLYNQYEQLAAYKNFKYLKRN